jgi:4-hydroxybenzoate polyprenyltransferase
VNIYKIYKHFITVFVEIGLVAGIMGGIKIIISTFILTDSVYLLPVLMGVLAATPVYLLDRVKYISEDIKSEKKTDRLRIVKRYDREIVITALLLYCVYFYIGYIYLKPIEVLIINFQYIILIIYPRLKDFLTLDTVAISITNSILLLCIPVFIINVSYSIEFFLLFIYGFIVKFSETELSNIRDINSDKEAGHKTLPIKYSIRNINNIILGGEIIGLIILMYLIDLIIVKLFIFLCIKYYIILEYDLSSRNISETMLYNRLLKLILGLLIIFYELI